MKRAFAVVPLICLLCASAPASARPVDVRSAHTALRAYKSYLTSIIASQRAAKQSDDAFVAAIAAKCPNVLASVNTMPVTPTSRPILLEFGREAGADVVLPAVVPYQKALATLTRRINKLRWSSSARKKRIASALAAQRTLYTLAPSDLCADASALAASNAQSLPPGTAPFVAAYDNATKAAGLDALRSAINRYRSARDKKLRRTVSKLTGRAAASLVHVVNADAPRLLAALGLTP